MPTAKPLPPAEYLKECFSYDSETGVLHWKVRPLAHFSDTQHMTAWNTRYAGRPVGHVARNGYIGTHLPKQCALAHRVVWAMCYGDPALSQIDHIDGDRANNRIGNLRLATASENSHNSRMRKHNKHEAKGVCYDKNRHKWSAYITHEYKNIFLGRFITIEEAHLAYCAAADRLHGDFANYGR
jgi:HNH endonuclease/AP2 domain